MNRNGRYLELITDLESADEADTLVASFDAAVDRWKQFWSIPDGQLDQWKVTAYVMRDRAAFDRAGLIPPRVPNFRYGYALGDSVWILAQPSEYYTRHLLLHEGAHSLAFHQFGGAGPTWFMEGTAEMLATHRSSGPETRVLQVPSSREEVPYWGRFKKMNQLRTASRVPSIETVMKYAPTLSGDVEAYGWSWVAAMMLSSYPEYRESFDRAARMGKDDGPNFNRQLYSRLSKDWPALAARWSVAAHDIDFGFDWNQQHVDIATGDPPWDGRPITMNVRADRGWQSIGVRVPAGATIDVAATGTVTLAASPRPWTSYPEGVTVEYHDGRPLGQLIARVLPNRTPREANLPPPDVHAVGAGATIKVPEHSWILFRVNDHVGDLNNNSGQFEVVIRPSESPRR